MRTKIQLLFALLLVLFSVEPVISQVSTTIKIGSCMQSGYSDENGTWHETDIDLHLTVTFAQDRIRNGTLVTASTDEFSANCLSYQTNPPDPNATYQPLQVYFQDALNNNVALYVADEKELTAPSSVYSGWTSDLGTGGLNTLLFYFSPNHETQQLFVRTAQGFTTPRLAAVTPSAVGGTEFLEVWFLPRSSSLIDETGNGPACPNCGMPISLANGNTYIQQTDLQIPGLGGGLDVSRTWNSKWPQTQLGSKAGLFGDNWRSTYEERVTTSSDGSSLKYARNDGSFWSFNRVGSTSQYTLIAPANGDATAQVSSTVLVVKYKNGTTKTFDPVSGSLLTIADRNNNTTTLGYDQLNRLTTVQDAAKRKLYFRYQDDTYLVNQVTTDIGLTATYQYDTQNRLQVVTRPDGSTLNFEYDQNSLITAVKDSQGKILESHTYDSQGRGLSSSRADGVDSVTLQYPY